MEELLLNLAAIVASKGYTPENKGIYSQMSEPGVSTYTPENIHAIFKEFEELFSKG
ncbi:MAG: hypothetical protein WC756_06730 [Taibaiella sp.]|jgi:hypothetical protein